MRPGGLTPEGYLGFVKREHLDQYSNTELGEEPERVGMAALPSTNLEENRKKVVCDVDVQPFVVAVGGTCACVARAGRER